MDRDRTQVSDMLSRSRADAGISQQKMAVRMGISKKTVQNWESGTSMPDIDEFLQWFSVLGTNPMPYIKEYLYGSKKASRDSISELHSIIDDLLTEKEADILIYLLTGKHGSSPYAYMQKIVADLQSTIGSRQATAVIIENNYENALARGEITTPEGPQPDMKCYKDAIEKGKYAYIHGENGYTVK